MRATRGRGDGGEDEEAREDEAAREDEEAREDEAARRAVESRCNALARHAPRAPRRGQSARRALFSTDTARPASPTDLLH